MLRRPATCARTALCLALLAAGGGTLVACGDRPYQVLDNADLKIDAVQQGTPTPGRLTVGGSIAPDFDGTIAVQVTLRPAGAGRSLELKRGQLRASRGHWSTTFVLPRRLNGAKVVAVRATGSSKTAVGNDVVRP